MSKIERVRIGSPANAFMRKVLGGASTVATGLFALVSIGVLGCVDASVDPSKISARVVSAGTYSLRAGFPDFVESRTDIPCEVGRLFGVDYEFEVAGDGSGVLPVQFRWLHPAIPIEGSSRTGTETEGGTRNPVMERGRSRLLGRSLWSIGKASERVPGVYRFEIQTIKEKQTILSQEFEVEGC